MSIPLAKFKDLLGSLAETLTDEQTAWLYEAEYKLADAMFEWWLRNRTAPAHIAREPEREDTTSNNPDEENLDEN